MLRFLWLLISDDGEASSLERRDGQGLDPEAPADHRSARQGERLVQRNSKAPFPAVTPLAHGLGYGS